MITAVKLELQQRMKTFLKKYEANAVKIESDDVSFGSKANFWSHLQNYNSIDEIKELFKKEVLDGLRDSVKLFQKYFPTSSKTLNLDTDNNGSKTFPDSFQPDSFAKFIVSSNSNSILANNFFFDDVFSENLKKEWFQQICLHSNAKGRTKAQVDEMEDDNYHEQQFLHLNEKNTHQLNRSEILLDSYSPSYDVNSNIIEKKRALKKAQPIIYSPKWERCSRFFHLTAEFDQSLSPNWVTFGSLVI